MRGPKHGSGERSNLYSESKFSNWASFNPFESEISSRPEIQSPAARVHIAGTDASVPIYVRKTHPAFVRPCEASEVVRVLSRVPPRFLGDLSRIVILGGTTKQDRACKGLLFRFGCYGGGIYLHAFPRRLLTLRWKLPPKSSVVREYVRWGCEHVLVEGVWQTRFSLESLRRFYLYDVLLHEVGHHADRVWNRNRREAEKFAEWFAVEQARALRDTPVEEPTRSPA